MNQQIKSVTNKNGTRYYTSPKTGNKYPSVTTVLAKYEDRTWLKAWRESEGPEHKKISQAASTLGTRVHSCCENYMNSGKSVIDFSKYENDAKIESSVVDEIKARFFAYKEFLDIVTPISVEEKLIWEAVTAEGSAYGFGGAVDVIGQIQDASVLKCLQKIEVDGAVTTVEEEIFKPGEKITFVADFKNNRSYKSAKDFIKAYCQLSAYAAAKNRDLAPENWIKHGFILSTTCSEVKKKTNLNIYYLNLDQLDFYFGWFFRFVQYYFGLKQLPGEDKPKPWSTFKEYACGYKFEGKDEEGKNIWGKRERDYLAKKLTLCI